MQLMIEHTDPDFDPEDFLKGRDHVRIATNRSVRNVAFLNDVS